MSDLAQTIEAFKKASLPKMPQQALATMQQATEALAASGQVEGAAQVGDMVSDFDLPEVGGTAIRLSEMLVKGPVVLSFYRGGWCPYCNMEMQALQKALPDIEQCGASLLAIAPETPEHAGETRDTGNITFPLLFDAENAVARRCGLVFTLAAELRGIYQNFDIDLAANQGNDRFELPMPATFIVAPDGKIAFAFVNADYSQRMEPDRIVEVLKNL